MKGSCGNSTCKIVKDGYLEKREEIRLQNKETQNMARKKSHLVVRDQLILLLGNNLLKFYTFPNGNGDWASRSELLNHQLKQASN